MLHLHPHPALHALFEALGYTLGFALYRRLRRTHGDILPKPQRWSVIAAATVGALFGSRILGLLEQAPRTPFLWSHLLLPTGGKTIVGGLLGGWLAVELTKRLQGIHTRTGDLFVLPLCLGIAIGRIGCFLAGLADDTYGTPTHLPWATRLLAIDFGDGIPRHPTQLYEILFLAALALTLHQLHRRSQLPPVIPTEGEAAAEGPASPPPPTPTTHLPNGTLFRLFLAAYLLWRLLIDLLKPQPLIHGLNAIQWACLAGLLTLAASALRTRLHAQNSAH